MGIKKKLFVKVNFITILLLLILSSYSAKANYYGPLIIVEGKWGKNEREFGYRPEDTQDYYPSIKKIDLNGNIIILDIVNSRIKIIKLDGSIQKTIKPQKIKNIIDWPAFMDSDSKGNIYTSNYDEKLQCYNKEGNLKWAKDIFTGEITVLSDDSIIIWGSTKEDYQFTKISSKGDIIEKYREKPIEMGNIQEQDLGGEKYKVIIKYPDYQYEVIVNNAIEHYYRDLFGNLVAIEKRAIGQNENAIFVHTVHRFERCTNEEIIYNMPKSQYEKLLPEEGREVIIEYGEPIISPLGDLYCWARTKTEYKILKWIWQGPEDAPQSLQISIGLAGLKLDWQKPVKDADTVTGYQILRSTEVCGPFNEVTTVKKDKLIFEDRTIKPPWKYYYVVKAVRDKKLSGESNKVYMQWK
jgi:hypothetical protein